MIIDTIALTRGLKVIFNKALAEIPINEGLLTLATRYNSTGSSETHGWFDDVPIVREWLGPKKAKSLSDHSYTLVNKDWEGTIEVDRNELDDDQYGMILPRVQMLAIAAREKEALELSDRVINGTSELAHDGIAFFSNASGVRLIDNLLSGSGTSLTNLETDLASARAAMLAFYFAQSDRKFGFKLDTVVCPPALELLFMKLMESTSAVSGSAAGIVNPFRNILKQVIVDPRLSDANDWYGFATTYPIKPLLFQDRKKVEFKALVEGSDLAFNWKKYAYSAESRFATGYSFPQMAVKVVNT